MHWWWDYEKFCQYLWFTSSQQTTNVSEKSGIPSCIDLILTNKAKSFQSADVTVTGLPNCYRMTISALKMHFRKLPQNVISYRNLKNENERFMDSLQSSLNTQDSDYVKRLHLFFNIFQKVLKHLAPRKNVHTRE